jgi:hypothetical protein
MTATALKPVKPLQPKSHETKYTGGEPQWRAQPEAEQRMSQVIGAFTWYNYHYGKKDAKNFLIDWLTRNDRQKDARNYHRVPDSSVSLQAAWLSRMSLMGLALSDRELLYVNDHVSQQCQAALSVKEVTKAVDEPIVPKITIQDRLREKMMEAAGELEGMFDDMLRAGCKMSADFKPITVLRGMNVSPQMVGDIAGLWQQRLEELEAVAEGRDAQLVEGYGNFGKLQIRGMIKFVEQVIADCNSYRQLKKVERKPRAKKAKPPEVIARGFKILVEDAELKLRSETAARLVGASEAWLYDVKKRKLIHAVADSHVGSFTVKGSGLIGLDTAQTLQKTLRKPAEQLKTLMAASVPNARKFFKDIKATEIKWNGRGNENLVILRVK